MSRAQILTALPACRTPAAVTGVCTTTHPDTVRPDRPLHIQIRLRLRPEVSPGAMELAAARLPAVYAGAVLAGDHDLELRLACRDGADLAASIAELRRCGAAECQVEVVLRGFYYPPTLELVPPLQPTQ